LKDSSGQLLEGQINVNFAIYDEPTDGTPYWQETQNVQFSAGKYSVLLGLGNQKGIPTDVFRSGQARWLGVRPELDGEAERPRVFLASVPYALKASDADTLGGLPASAFVRAQTVTTADVAHSALSGSDPVTLKTRNASSGRIPTAVVPSSGLPVSNTCQQSNVVRCVDSANLQHWAGSDVGYWIRAAIADLPPTGGIVDARAATASVASVSPMIMSSSPKPNVTVLLPATHWTINDSLIKSAGCWNDLSIIGVGYQTQITTTVPRTLFDFSGCASGMAHLRISGLSWSDAARSNSSLGFFAYIWNCDSCEIDHNFIRNSGQGGIFLGSSSTMTFSQRSHIHDNWISNTYGSNILVATNSQKNEIDHNICYQTKRNCIDINGRWNSIHDNFIDTVSGGSSSDEYGILIYQTSGKDLANNNSVFDNYVQNSEMEAIRVDVSDFGAGDGTKIRGNTVSACGTATGRACIGVVSNIVGASKDIDVIENTVRRARGAGIEIDGVRGAIIANNMVSETHSDCFEFHDSRNYIVTANTARDCRAGNSGTYGGFLFFGSASDDLFVANQQFDTTSKESFGVGFLETLGGMSVNLGQNTLTAVPHSVVLGGQVAIRGSLQISGEASGCTTAALSGAICATQVNMSAPISADADNSVQCTGMGIESGVPVNGGISTLSGRTIEFRTVAATPAAAQFTSIRCTASRPPS
jgi:hypothetical protein